VIGDPYLESHIIANYLESVFPGDHIAAVDWELADLAELALRNRHMELNGPDHSLLTEKVASVLQSELWDAVVTQFAPLAAQAVERVRPGGWVGVLRAGTENVDLKACQERNITVFSSPGRNANAVAEFALGMILAETRQIARSHEQFRRGDWEKSFGRPLPRELKYLTVGIVGCGAVGRLLAEKLVALGSSLLICDPIAGERAIEGLPADKVRMVELEELLQKSDVVTLHARANGDGPLIGEKQLSLMRKDAILVNTARAELVDEAAVLRALSERRIGGVAFDVYAEEPPAADSPWRTIEQATLTPHMGGATADAFTRSPEVLCKIMARYATRGDLHGVVVHDTASREAFVRRWEDRMRQIIERMNDQ